MPAKIILFNKPFNTLSQFTDKSTLAADSSGRNTLKAFLSGRDCRGFYPAGRLDRDSEGLLLLTNNGKLQSFISHPDFKLAKKYLVQVEGKPSQEKLLAFERGLQLADGITKPAQAKQIEQPNFLWERSPPIRYRKNDTTTWLEITLYEGRNRQVRRMTAAIGHPTLRLIRQCIGDWTLGALKPGEFTFVSATKFLQKLESMYD